MKVDLTERLSEDLAALARDAEKILGGKNGKDSDLAQNAQEIRDRLAAALERADQAVNELSAPTSFGLATVENFIRDHPFQAVGLAAGAGLLLGFLLKGSDRR